MEEDIGRLWSRILVELRSPHERDKALEQLAMSFVQVLNLDFKGWLLQGAVSNGMEVELVADGGNIPLSRWLIQCRAASRADVGMDELATAVGRGFVHKPSIMLSVTTGRFSRTARYYASETMRLTNLRILMIDADDLSALADGERRVEDILARDMHKARNISNLAYSLPQV